MELEPWQILPKPEPEPEYNGCNCPPDQNCFGDTD